MFNKIGVRKEVTPKRVYAFLKLVNYNNGNYDERDICELIQPSFLTKSQDEISKVIKFCKDEEFVKVDFDGKIHINIDKENLYSEVNFRKFINKILYEDGVYSVFLQTSEEMLASNKNLYDIKGFTNMASYFIDKPNINNEVLLGWRFWAAFLGFGFIFNSQFVLNPHQRIKDLLEIHFKDDFGKSIEFRIFIERLVQASPDFKKSINNNELSSALSIALTTLKNMGVITLEEVKDSSDRWAIILDNTVSYVTNVKINGGEYVG